MERRERTGRVERREDTSEDLLVGPVGPSTHQRPSVQIEAGVWCGEVAWGRVASVRPMAGAEAGTGGEAS